MGWLKIDDKFPRNPKIIGGDLETSWFYTCALAYCAEQLTDGFIANGAINMIAPHVDDPRATADRCVTLGLFIRAEGGYQIPHFTDYNPSREETLRKRAEAAERQAKSRAKQQSKRDNQCESQRESQCDNTRDSHGDSHPPRPVPSRPVPSRVVTTSRQSVNARTGTVFDDDWVTSQAREHIDAHMTFRRDEITNPGGFKRRVKARITETIRDVIADGGDSVDIENALERHWPTRDPVFDDPPLPASVRRLHAGLRAVS